MSYGSLNKADTLTLSVVQSRWDQDILTNTHNARRLINEAARMGSQVVVFPEAHLTTYDFPYAKSLSGADIEKAIREVQEECARQQIYAITGTLQKRSADEKLLNMAHVVSPNGEIVHEYAKLHLGGSTEKVDCRPGKKVSLFELYGVTCSIIICRDGRHPDLTTLITMAGAEIIFQISNNCDTIEKSWWKDRAGRSSQPLSPRTANFHICANAVGFNRAGDQLTLGNSFVLDSSGLPLAEANRFDENLLTTRIVLSRASRRFATQSLEAPELFVDDWARMVQKVIAHKDDSVE